MRRAAHLPRRRVAHFPERRLSPKRAPQVRGPSDALFAAAVEVRVFGPGMGNVSPLVLPFQTQPATSRPFVHSSTPIHPKGSKGTLPYSYT